MACSTSGVRRLRREDSVKCRKNRFVHTTETDATHTALNFRASRSSLFPAAVDLAGVKMSMNPFCEIAVEEAVRLKEKKIAAEVCRLVSFCSHTYP